MANFLEDRRWFNQAQPRPLQYATWLLYWSAVWSLLRILERRSLLPVGEAVEIILWAFAIAVIPLAVLGASDMAMYRRRGCTMAWIAALLPAAGRAVDALSALGEVARSPYGTGEWDVALVLRHTFFPVRGFGSFVSYAFEIALGGNQPIHAPLSAAQLPAGELQH